MKRLLCFLLFLMMFNLSIIKNLTDEEKNNDNESLYSVEVKKEKDIYSINESIKVTYFIDKTNNIINCKVLKSDFETVKIDNNCKSVIVSFECTKNDYSGEIKTMIELSSGYIIEENLFILSKDEQVYISDSSFDDAFLKYLNYQVELKQINKDQYYELINENAQRCVTEKQNGNNSFYQESNVLNSKSGEPLIYGILSWTDDSNISHPLQFVKVEVYKKTLSSNVLLETVYTNSNGYYSYHFNSSGYETFIKVYAGDGNIMVKDSSGNDYSFIPTTTHYVSNSSAIEDNRNFNMSADLGRAMQISQAVLFARKYAYAMMNTMPEAVSVYYPSGSNCTYNRTNKRINITGSSATSGYPNSYASWDAIMHEYGHHIQYEEDIINSPGYAHYSSHSDVDDYGKDDGIRLAWGESWPTVFALLAQNYYSSSLQNINTVGDTYYTAYNGLNYDIETTNIALGDGCERSIMAVLWDLFDSVNETNDTISLGHTNYWNVTTGDNSKTFSEFVSYFYTQYPNYIYELGKNLSFYKMSSSIPSISNLSNISFTNAATISFSPQGGSTTCPNDSFVIVVLDETNNEIMRTDEISTFSYTFSISQWRSIIDYNSNEFSFAVASFQTDTPITGPYYSEKTSSIIKPKVDSTFSLSDSSPTITDNSSVYGSSSNYNDRYVFYKLNVSYSKNYTINITADYNVNVKIYNSVFDELSYSTTYITNGVSISVSLSNGINYLCISFQNVYQSGIITTQFVGHTHSYGASYSWYNYTQHHTICGCGAMQLEYHVTSGTVPGQQYATCLLCGGLARLGLVGPMSLNTYPHTINGSYILPNGVIVLADDDIDAYFAGTLVFIYPNDDLLNNYRTYPFLVRKKEQFVFGVNEQ